MSRITFRIFIVLAVVSISGIVATQVYWFRKAFDLKENEFQRDVNAALQSVAFRLIEMNGMPRTATNPVQRVSTNYFVVDVNGPIQTTVLEILLTSEFSKRNISGYAFGVYDCMEKCLVGALQDPPVVRTLQAGTPSTRWVTAPKEGYYFAVHFPALEANLAGQMNIWIFSSAVLLIVVIFFSYALAVILRQRRLSEIQKDFINNMTHEFKTPLSTISISAAVLREGEISRERLLNYSTIIQREALRLKQQVERVLQAARLERQELMLKREPLHVHELIQRALDNNHPNCQERGGQFIFRPDASRDQVLGDSLHLVNVFSNLIDNALKYCEEKPRLLIQSENTGHYIQLTFQDNGIGILPAHQARIFDRFYRVPTGNVHNVKGFGLGLHYVRLVIEGHRGKIRVISTPGNGSQFIITLPLHA